ncbi:hypothetical protein ACLQ2P_40005 [Actinomadura citrea]|uniref:hypothetical protein n=1 Tax=Actinomadura citrea TaxID=46158 RepID=UPI003CE531A7
MSTAVPLALAYAERHNALAEDYGSAGAEAGAESSDGGAGVHSREAVVERAGRLVLKALDQAGGLEALATAHDAVSAHHGDNYLPLLGPTFCPHPQLARPDLLPPRPGHPLRPHRLLHRLRHHRRRRGPVNPDDLATISPYITHVIRRFGSWILNLVPPAGAPTTHLDLESRVLFVPKAARRSG